VSSAAGVVPGQIADQTDTESPLWLNLVLAIRFGFSRASRLDSEVAGLRLLWKEDPRRMEGIVQSCREVPRGAK